MNENTSIGKAIAGFLKDVLEEIGLFVKLALLGSLIIAGGVYMAMDISLLTAFFIGVGAMVAFVACISAAR